MFSDKIGYENLFQLREIRVFCSSRVVAPRIAGQMIVNKTISRFTARPHLYRAANPDWRKYQATQVINVTDAGNAAKLNRLCFEWKAGI
jgi:hypothetical protein